jgi:hypothetical protein
VAGLLLIAACSATSRAGRATAVSIQVENDLIPRADVTLQIVVPGGSRRFVGGVPPGAEREFRFDDASYVGQYRMVARKPDGEEVVSLPFNLFAGAIVAWSLGDNAVVVNR